MFKFETDSFFSKTTLKFCVQVLETRSSSEVFARKKNQSEITILLNDGGEWATESLR